MLLLPELIQKEDVSILSFPKDEVLFNRENVTARNIDLKYAMKLGNLDRYKVKITFQDDEDIKRVETTVWAVTERMVVLKKGVFIPIHRVHEIKFL
ncbi:MAG: hypothetical protein JKX73_09295 [Flavobacteriales bacterium]|nr:hypothetical protein [Flavobacteriales bacterium]